MEDSSPLVVQHSRSSRAGLRGTDLGCRCPVLLRKELDSLKRNTRNVTRAREMKSSLATTVLHREGSVGPPTLFSTCIWTHSSPTLENKASLCVCVQVLLTSLALEFVFPAQCSELPPFHC
ncbi:hypothetical protein AAY473_023475 [Plecturocebus cupreus]